MGNHVKCYKSPSSLKTKPTEPEKNNNDKAFIRGTTVNANEIMLKSVCFVNESSDKYFSKEELFYYEKKSENTIKLDKMIIQRYPTDIKWREGEILGVGAFGEVIMGFNEENGQLMAVKQIPIKHNSADKLEAIELEIQILKTLKHNNIVKYIGTKKSAKKLFIFLEYIAGGSISSILKRYGKLKENIIRLYTIQILQGLEYLHHKKVIHRDIKGGNVLVDNSGVCKLADFGSCKKITEISNQEQTLTGTANWMPPEMIQQVNSGRFADIWSLGCTVIEMATGKPPWSEYNNPLAIMFQIVNSNKPPELPTNLSETARDFLKKCLEVDWQKRHNCYKLLRHAFITGNAPIINQPIIQNNLLTIERKKNNKNLSAISEREEIMSGSDSRRPNGFGTYLGANFIDRENVVKMIESELKISKDFEDRLSVNVISERSLFDGEKSASKLQTPHINVSFVEDTKDMEENASIECIYEFNPVPSRSEKIKY